MKHINTAMFLLAFVLTTAFYFLLTDKVKAVTAVPTLFLIFAQGVFFLTPANYRKKEFPLRLPLVLAVNPLYLLLTLAIVITAPLMDLSLRMVMVMELAAFAFLAFPHLIALMTYSSREENDNGEDRK